MEILLLLHLQARLYSTANVVVTPLLSKLNQNTFSANPHILLSLLNDSSCYLGALLQGLELLVVHRLKVVFESGLISY